MKVKQGIKAGEQLYHTGRNVWKSSGLSLSHIKKIFGERIKPVDIDEVTTKIIEQNPRIAEFVSNNKTKKELTELVGSEYGKMKHDFGSAKTLDAEIHLGYVMNKLKDLSTSAILAIFEPEAAEMVVKLQAGKYTKQIPSWVDRLNMNLGLYTGFGVYYLKEKIRSRKNEEEKQAFKDLKIGKKSLEFMTEELPKIFIDKGIKDPAEYRPYTDMMEDYLIKRVAYKFYKDKGIDYKSKGTKQPSEE
jgi:uncharacterized protein (DUF2164 family)